MRKADTQGRTLFTLSWELTLGYVHHHMETELDHFILSFLSQLPFDFSLNHRLLFAKDESGE